jgi:hypothetical protein
MEDWQVFSNRRFALQFRYPAQGTDGEPVERVETEEEGMLRVHVLAPNSREVYFEVTRYDPLSAHAEYQRHHHSLSRQFDPLTVSDLTATPVGSLPAYQYTFEWDQGRRSVLLVERGNSTYRILYNPRFAINGQILSTVQWINDP